MGREVEGFVSVDGKEVEGLVKAREADKMSVRRRVSGGVMRRAAGWVLDAGIRVG